MDNLKLWLVGAVCAVAGPSVVAHIQGYWALLLVDTIQAVGAKGQPSIFTTMTLFNIVGALVAATALSLPLGLVARSKPWAVGAFVGLIVAATLEVLVYPIERPGFHLVMHAIEMTSFVGGCALMTWAVSRFCARRANPSFKRTPSGAA